MTNSTFGIFNDLDTTASNLNVAFDTFSFVLEGLDKAMAEIKSEDGAAVRMENRYCYYSRMLFLILEQAQSMNEHSAALIAKAFELDRKERGA